MSTVRNPVGPQPPSVYWRRRLLVLLGLVAVVVIIVLIIVRPGSEDAGRETPAPTTTTAPATEPSGEPQADGACNPGVILVEPVTDADSYESGEQPQISVRLTNTGSSACTFTIGADQLVFSIVSGDDPIWTSSDCLTTPAAAVELQPNQPLGDNALTSWDRTRSSPDTCSSSRPEVIAGGATYRLSVKIGTLESETDRPFLLY